MSHLTPVECKVEHKTALDRAASRLGCAVDWSASKFRSFGGRQYDCQGKVYVLNPDNDSCYEVGLIRQGDGTYQMSMDNWDEGKGLCTKVGRSGHMLAKQYGIEAGRIQAQREGFRVREVTKEKDGRRIVQLICER